MAEDNPVQDPPAPKDNQNDDRIDPGALIEQLLAQIPEELSLAFRLSAIPHRINPDLFARLVEKPVDFDRFVSRFLPLHLLVQESGGYYRMAPWLRTSLLEWWRGVAPDRFEAANEAALAYFTDIIPTSPPQDRPAFDRERIYHLIIQNPREGLLDLGAQFETAVGHFQLGRADELVGSVLELKESLPTYGRQRLRYYEARIDLLFEQGDWGAGVFEDFAQSAEDRLTQALAGWSLGDLRVKQRQWSEAKTALEDSLDLFKKTQQLIYQARVMSSLGNTYQDLAEHCGGAPAETAEPAGRVTLWLDRIQHLPFLAYEWLLRRARFFPLLYFGTNYQGWLIDYLHVEAMRWYQKADATLRKTGEATGRYPIRLALANLDHQLGRWGRARGAFDSLLESEAAQNSRYRQAQIHDGQGRALFEEGRFEPAAALLGEALEVFQLFEDNPSIGRTAEILGRSWGRLDLHAPSAQAFLEALPAYRKARDPIKETQVLSELERLMESPGLSPDLQARMAEAISQTRERWYINRFPVSLLQFFRRLALIGALPLSYLLVFVSAAALTQIAAIVEALLLANQVTGGLAWLAFGDLLVLGLTIVLPLPLAFWVYRLIYGAMGALVVRYFGRQISPIEKEQPGFIITDSRELCLQSGREGDKEKVPWQEINALTLANVCLWQRPIRLVSRLFLSTGGEPIKVEGTTAGYPQFLLDLEGRLKGAAHPLPWNELSFPIFRRPWILLTLLLSLLLGLTMEAPFILDVTPEAAEAPIIGLPVSTFLINFVMSSLLIYPMVSVWRFIIHRGVLERTTGTRAGAIPTWLLWLAALLITLFTALWILWIVLYNMGGSP